MYASTPNEVKWESPVEVLTINQGAGGGIGSDAFAQLGASLKGSDGRILDNLLASKGRKRSDYGKVAIAGFSAWHGLANQLLLADGDRIDAAISVDSCFSAMNSPAKPGYASFARMAARGQKLFVLTASKGGGAGSGATLGPGGVDYSTGFDCVRASLANEHLSPTSVPAGMPPIGEGSCKRAGSLWALEYLDLRHDQHAHELSVPLMQTFLAPYLAGTSLTTILKYAAVVGAGWLATDYFLD